MVFYFWDSCRWNSMFLIFRETTLHLIIYVLFKYNRSGEIKICVSRIIINNDLLNKPCRTEGGFDGADKVNRQRTLAACYNVKLRIHKKKIFSFGIEISSQNRFYWKVYEILKKKILFYSLVDELPPQGTNTFAHIIRLHVVSIWWISFPLWCYKKVYRKLTLITYNLTEQLNNNFLLMSHSISQSHLLIYLLSIYLMR